MLSFDAPGCVLNRVYRIAMERVHKSAFKTLPNRTISVSRKRRRTAVWRTLMFLAGAVLLLRAMVELLRGSKANPTVLAMRHVTLSNNAAFLVLSPFA